MDSLVPVFVCVGVVLIFGSLLMVVARLFSSKASLDSLAKQQPYECGIEGEKQSTSRVPVQFYLTAILFILFDIEIVFLFPWALAFNDFIVQGEILQVLGGISVFLLIFIYGLFWEIYSKALQWK